MEFAWQIITEMDWERKSTKFIYSKKLQKKKNQFDKAANNQCCPKFIYLFGWNVHEC